MEDLHEKLDKDIIDEINQIPTDFDFQEHEAHCESINNQHPAFYRSNSYNRKPVKEVPVNNYHSNRIQTPNKTVTFYRSKVLANPIEINKQSSFNRGTSLRSNSSFACVSEEVEEEET